MVDVTARHRAGQDRETFLNGVSHELRTPLSAILLWTQVLRNLDSNDPRHREGVDTIEQSARAEAQLVDDLLDLALARSNLAKPTIGAPSVDPSSVVEAAIDAARSLASAKHIAIETAFADDLAIRVDPRRLGQIASNLLSNAIKFSPVGGRIWVALTRFDGVVELSVRDSGKGIPSDFAKHLFEAFSQEDRSSTRPQAGIGIGLALVKQCVDREGGTIAVENGGNGRGATFTVRLPA